MENLQYFCDKFIEFLFKNNMRIEIEQSSMDKSIAIHFYHTTNKELSRNIRIWVDLDRYDIDDSAKPIFYKVVYIGDKDNIFRDYTKKGLCALKDYYDLCWNVTNRINNGCVPAYSYKNGTLLDCLKRSYVKYGKRLRVVEV